jgi:transposase
VLVHQANVQDHNGGKLLLESLKGCFPRLKLIWADSAYKKGGFVEWVKATLGWEVEIVEHPWSGLRGVWAPKDAIINWEQIRPSGFHVLKWRWIVERPFAWLSTWRRLAKDYEVLPASEEAWISIAMIRIMLRRLAHTDLRPFHTASSAGSRDLLCKMLDHLTAKIVTDATLHLPPR